MAFNFANRRDIEAVLAMVRRGDGTKQRNEARDVQQGDAVTSIIIDIPSSGIPAMVSTTPGSADCTPYYINDAGTLAQVAGSTTVTVYNLADAAVTGSAWGQAKNVLGKWVIDVEYCDGVASTSGPYGDVYS